MNNILEIIEIIKPAKQGITTPFLCRASDNCYYYIKWGSATVAGLIREWIGANLAKEFGLPVPSFQIAYLEPQLASCYSSSPQLKGGYVFASKRVNSVCELKYDTALNIDVSMKALVLLFDLWVENADRTLSEKGGNPNLLWKSNSSEMYVIDHNLIFDEEFSVADFRETHVFNAILKNCQDDLVQQLNIEVRLKKSLACWQLAWGKIPKEWIDENKELQCFNPEKHLQRLTREANGDIWSKLL
ncbi:MAG: HipA family kinase [Methylococcaceae bacterium]